MLASSVRLRYFSLALTIAAAEPAKENLWNKLKSSLVRLGHKVWQYKSLVLNLSSIYQSHRDFLTLFFSTQHANLHISTTELDMFPIALLYVSKTIIKSCSLSRLC